MEAPRTDPAAEAAPPAAKPAKPVPAADTSARQALWYTLLAAGDGLLKATVRGDTAAWQALQRAHDIIVRAARERGLK